MRLGSFLARTFVLLPGLVLLSGCDPDPYPESLTYPMRADLLVLKTPDGRDYAETYAPGQLDGMIATIRVKASKDDKFEYLDPADVAREDRLDLDKELAKRFGRPSDPMLKVTDPDLATFAKDLQVDEDSLYRGSILYRRHCLHCHGVPGDGHGSTATWLNPPPRDYRQGRFKFTSVVGSQISKPSRADLVRTLTEGIEGTSMPTFKAQPHRDIEALVSYVIHLSIRGQVEYETLRELKKKSDETKNLGAFVQAKTNDVARQWKDESVPIMPGDMVKASDRLHPYPKEYEDNPAELEKSIERGYKLFIGDGICISCHTDYGRQPLFLHDDWGTLVRPRNLTEGIYRGGRRPVDLYYRIHSGIGPSKMPGANTAVKENPKAIWDLVNFVKAMPYPKMLPESVREKVYGPRK